MPKADYAITPDMTFKEKMAAMTKIVAEDKLDKLAEFFADMVARPVRKAFLEATPEAQRGIIAELLKNKVIETTEYGGLKRGLHWPRGLLASEDDLYHRNIDLKSI